MMERTYRLVSPARIAELARQDSVDPSFDDLKWAGSTDDDLKGEALELESFQATAAARGLEALRRWGGFILADDVGLGKTYVALQMARDAIVSGRHVLIVIPSALRRQWQPLVRRHLLGPSCANNMVSMTTHAQISRGSYNPSLVERGGLMIIDEAHAFRSPHTRRYGAAVRLAARRHLLLLTATPINNSLWDLYYLIRLFAGDSTFSACAIPDLRALFEDAAGAATTTPAFARLLDQVVIRRKRDDVRAEPRNGSRLRFPMRDPPEAISYGADGALPGSHEEILECIASLGLQAYGEGAATLMRFIMLKRLASSAAAFDASLSRMSLFLDAFCRGAEQGLIATPRDLFNARTSDGGHQIPIDALTFRKANVSDRLDRIALTARGDARLVTHMRDLLRAASVSDDKALQITALAHDRLRHTPVLIFTEFRETAADLWRRWWSHEAVGLVHGGGSFLGRNPSSRQAVIERFASGRFHRRERVRVLIATDVLSEGLNLQNCAHVVSYDLPWNPVRLIQRIGRIDRLGSPHERIFAFNFVPDRYLESYLGILDRLRIKLHAISLALGADTPILSDSARSNDNSWAHVRALLPTQHTSKRRAPPGAHDPAIIARPLACRGDVSVRNVIDVAYIPFESLGDGDVQAAGLLCAGGYLCAFACSPRAVCEIDVVMLLEACRGAHLSQAPIETPAHDFVDRFVRRIENHARVLCRPRSRLASMSQIHLSKQIQCALARVPGAPTTDEMARADRILARLAIPASPSLEGALKEVCRNVPQEFALLAGLIEGALGNADGARPEAGSEPVFLGLLLPIQGASQVDLDPFRR